MKFYSKAPLFGVASLGGMGLVLTHKMLLEIPAEVGDHRARWFIVIGYWTCATITVAVMVHQAMRDPDDQP